MFDGPVSIKRTGMDNLQSGGNVIIIFIILLLVLIILYFTLNQFIIIRVTNNEVYKWWNDNNGKNYDGKFNLTAMFAKHATNKIFSSIQGLFVGEAETLTLQQSDFILWILQYIYATDPTTGKPTGVVLPKTLCETVKISPGQGDAIFDAWYNNNPTRKVQVKTDNCSKSKLYSAPIDSTKKLSGYVQKFCNTNKYDKNSRWIYQYTNSDNLAASGLYPDSASTDDWCGLILEWLNGTSCVSTGDCLDYYWHMGTTDTKGLVVLIAPEKNKVKKPNGEDSDGIYDNWFNCTTDNYARPDNFLARMNILPLCPLVEFFINGKYDDGSGLTLDVQAFKNLLGEDTSPTNVLSGWAGYVTYMGDAPYDQLANFIKTSVNLGPSPPKELCNKKADVGKGATAFGASFLSSALSIGLAVAMMAGSGGTAAPEAAAVAETAFTSTNVGIFGGLVATGSAVLAGYQAGKPSCTN